MYGTSYCAEKTFVGSLGLLYVSLISIGCLRPTDSDFELPSNLQTHRAVLGRAFSETHGCCCVCERIMGLVPFRAHAGMCHVLAAVAVPSSPHKLDPRPQFLEKAKALGDFLLVGIHDDDTVNAEMGGGYPIMNLHERALRSASAVRVALHSFWFCVLTLFFSTVCCLRAMWTRSSLGPLGL